MHFQLPLFAIATLATTTLSAPVPGEWHFIDTDRNRGIIKFPEDFVGEDPRIPDWPTYAANGRPCQPHKNYVSRIQMSWWKDECMPEIEAWKRTHSEFLSNKQQKESDPALYAERHKYDEARRKAEEEKQDKFWEKFNKGTYRDPDNNGSDTEIAGNPEDAADEQDADAGHFGVVEGSGFSEGEGERMTEGED